MTHHELYKQIGIDPPRGVLLYGPPGTGKTMLAKAVAHHTTAAFIRVVGSEFVQKYLGEVSWEQIQYELVTLLILRAFLYFLYNKNMSIYCTLQATTNVCVRSFAESFM